MALGKLVGALQTCKHIRGVAGAQIGKGSTNRILVFGELFIDKDIMRVAVKSDECEPVAFFKMPHHSVQS